MYEYNSESMADNLTPSDIECLLWKHRKYLSFIVKQFIRSITHTNYMSTASYEDYLQEAKLAYVEQLKTKHGKTKPNYFTIRNRLYYLLKNNLTVNIPFNKVFSHYKDYTSVSIDDPGFDMEDPSGNDFISNIFANDFIETLGRSQRTLLFGLMQGMTYSEIGEQLFNKMSKVAIFKRVLGLRKSFLDYLNDGEAQQADVA